jgi:hypothetical protein
MHYGRIVGLGLGLGVLLNLFGLLGNGVLLRDTWAAAIPVRPERAMTGWPSVVVSLISDFVFGPALVWLYAAFLPRFGAGFATAMRAALAIWVLGVAVPYLGIVRIGWLPPGVVAGTCAVAMIGFVPAAWLTQRFYGATPFSAPRPGG